MARVRAATDQWTAGGVATTSAAAGDRSVGDIVGALGPEVIERLADPLIGGIHAGSVRTMSAAAVFPPLLEAAQAGGGLMRGAATGRRRAGRRRAIRCSSPSTVAWNGS